MKYWNFDISIYLILPFIMAIFLCIRTIFLFSVQKDGPQSINWKHQALILGILMYVSECLIGSAYFLMNNKAAINSQKIPSKNVPLVIFKL